MGLHALKHIPARTELHRESALLRCPNGHPARSLEEAEAAHANCVRARFGQLTKAKKELFSTLYCMSKYMEGGAPTQLGIFQSNSVRLTGRDSADGAVFPTFCRCNHSCRPNVVHLWRPDLQKLTILAARDIEAGEELYATYDGGQWTEKKQGTTAERRAFLQENFGFHCVCVKCKADDGTPEEAAARAAKNKKKREAAKRKAAAKKAEKAAALIDKMDDVKIA
ncbi:hypothetical protein TeGR_g1865 [Tetraparma gracilis]|jgi:hypothetical protein|uniref:SET domain-containing protein n=1 Tax=Tetraparma gracilis TaxID=2962635 RepID=A0ABQ6MSV8_9STRA|nr:hypothetical protein TeGR_g1865 [Tetraparma gracilis]